MAALTQQRCFNHAQREAAARCPGCGQFFCRECVTEHEDRLLCAVCLQGLAAPGAARRRALAGAARIVQCLLGILLLWFLFFLAGEGLLSLPSSFHESTFGRVPWLDSP